MYTQIVNSCIIVHCVQCTFYYHHGHHHFCFFYFGPDKCAIIAISRVANSFAPLIRAFLFLLLFTAIIVPIFFSLITLFVVSFGPVWFFFLYLALRFLSLSQPHSHSTHHLWFVIGMFCSILCWFFVYIHTAIIVAFALVSHFQQQLIARQTQSTAVIYIFILYRLSCFFSIYFFPFCFNYVTSIIASLSNRIWSPVNCDHFSLCYLTIEQMNIYIYIYLYFLNNKQFFYSHLSTLR